MKILVTGATGRIGANLVVQLLAAGHSIRSFVYPGDASRASKLDSYQQVETVYGDLRNYDDVRDAIKGVDAIYHLAAAFGGPFNNRDYLHINAMGTLNILESIREHCPNLHRFVYASTEGVYWCLTDNGRYFKEPIREDARIRHPHMPYLLTKWLGEELVSAYHFQYGVPTTALRFSTVIEPSEFLNEDGLPGLFLYSTACERWSNVSGGEIGNILDRGDPDDRAMVDALLTGWTGEEKLLLSRNPDGTAYRQHFSDVRDIAQGLALSIERDEAVGQVFNLAGAALFDWEVDVPRLAERYGLPVAEARLPYANHFELDLSKIKSRLGFQPKHDLDSILNTAEAIRRGAATDVIPTGIRYGDA